MYLSMELPAIILRELLLVEKDKTIINLPINSWSVLSPAVLEETLGTIENIIFINFLGIAFFDCKNAPFQ